ncbi:MAG: nucleotidyl transferase AbiEii/AbiGii toxin family protein [Gammaproteobacteria bacterium]|nr:nucleotidyl transferase AbiEii/AbiGii toxin family protein [Gammaproteobacteria bacterium]
MSDPYTSIDIGQWVRDAAGATRRQREITRIILHAIAATPSLREVLYLKGGVFMGLVYDSVRLSADIDFSVADTIEPDKSAGNILRKALDPALLRAASECGHPQTVLRVQSVKGMPGNRFPDAISPALRIKIGYADRGSRQHEQLLEGMASSIVAMDVSFNETIEEIQILQISDESTLLAYSLIDMIAEKYRALLQQPSRDRYREQDVYDLDILIRDPDLDDLALGKVLKMLVIKCKSRDIDSRPDSMDDPDIRRRAHADWNTIELETGDLPDFDGCFERIRMFYRKLPWFIEE